MGYRVGEFAALTGVTVRALQHYDRLGLLKPSRTDAGHRVYAPADQQRVRYILALRAIGMPLHQIAELLVSPASQLAAAFRAQRARLEQSRTGIEEAIQVLRQLETPSDVAETSLLDRLASGVEMLDALEAMRGYFSDEAWTQWESGTSTTGRRLRGVGCSGISRRHSMSILQANGRRSC